MHKILAALPLLILSGALYAQPARPAPGTTSAPMPRAQGMPMGQMPMGRMPMMQMPGADADVCIYADAVYSVGALLHVAGIRTVLECALVAAPGTEGRRNASAGNDANVPEFQAVWRVYQPGRP